MGLAFGTEGAAGAEESASAEPGVAPKLLVADEPTSYLDRENADLVIDLIIKSSKRFKVSSIVASHDISFKKKFDNSYTIKEKNLIKC